MVNQESEWHILSGGAQVKIVDRDADPMPVELVNCSSEKDFGEAIELIDKEIAKPKGELMNLASDIRNLERPEMSEEGKREGGKRIEGEMDKETEEGRKIWE